MKIELILESLRIAAILIEQMQRAGKRELTRADLEALRVDPDKLEKLIREDSEEPS